MNRWGIKCSIVPPGYNDGEMGHSDDSVMAALWCTVRY